jgi:pimeloyl-ACP methyl ester carboxylesterase
MKPGLILFILIIAYFKCFSQQNAYECNCVKIGLDSTWADTNRIKCYQVPVERNFSKPRGQHYLLAVAVAPALNKVTSDPLLYLHGGPGIETLGNLPRYLKTKTFTLLRQDRSMIFFDYRGTGTSTPALCNWLSDSVREITNAKLPLTERIPQMQRRYIKCKEELAAQNILLSDFSSLQSASDAEVIRKQLHINKWNIYSVSHGTTVALHMMRQFPDYIRSVILDSPFPPNAPWLDFIRPFDLSFKALEKAINEDSLNTQLFPSIRNDFIEITRRLRTSPLSIPFAGKRDSNQGYLFDDGDFIWSVWTAMLYSKSIPLIPMALKEMAAGNDSLILLWAKTYNDPNAFGQFALAQSKAILLYETKPRSEADRDNSLIINFPDFASMIIPGMDSSLAKVFRDDLPPHDYFNSVSSSIPTLVFSGEFDPVCSPFFGHLAAKTLLHSVMVVVPAASHAAMYTDDCTRNIAKAFYQNPLRKPDIGCTAKRETIKFVTVGVRDLLRK